ncbi:hypothetical protein THAOC_34957 [Thalassiosira oceanica]|uniref:Uncharacterized protein n=1 Tax=Thalassiosira oceanica TaxID=159749 RepID=K0R1N6_THAOC|nr:hypothetical protein THAOC_34957 [Thalassiosira oceanica]|eukprot:EJK46378.1 hypothetical protein THAOC_34957 [Thalassiosira oceanica]
MTTPGTPLRDRTPGIDESRPFLLRDSATCDSFRSGVVLGSAFEARNSRQNGVRQNPTLKQRASAQASRIACNLWSEAHPKLVEARGPLCQSSSHKPARSSAAARPQWVQGWIASDILAGDVLLKRRVVLPCSLASPAAELRVRGDARARRRGDDGRRGRGGVRSRSSILSWKAKNRKYIDDDSAAYIEKKTIDHSKEPFGLFYIMLKIHKLGPSLDGPLKTRPVVSDCSSVIHPIGKWADMMLQPFAKDQTSYLRDSFQLIDILSPIRVSKQMRLVTCDAVAM